MGNMDLGLKSFQAVAQINLANIIYIRCIKMANTIYKSMGDPYFLAHTLGLYIIKGAKVKTDKRDAFTLAKLLRVDAIPEAYIYPKDKQAIRDLLQKRNQLSSFELLNMPPCEES
jgi:hypothetical protein